MKPGEDRSLRTGVGPITVASGSKCFARARDIDVNMAVMFDN